MPDLLDPLGHFHQLHRSHIRVTENHPRYNGLFGSGTARGAGAGPPFRWRLGNGLHEVFFKGKVMETNELNEGLIGILRAMLVELVRRDGPDLTARQLGVFLTCYLQMEAQTVRGLAATLGVSKPAITRALDRLSEFDLVRRRADPVDRRSVLVQRTGAGMGFLREMRSFLSEAASIQQMVAGPPGTFPRIPPYISPVSMIN